MENGKKYFFSLEMEKYSKKKVMEMENIQKKSDGNGKTEESVGIIQARVARLYSRFS